MKRSRLPVAPVGASYEWKRAECALTVKAGLYEPLVEDQLALAPWSSRLQELSPVKGVEPQFTPGRSVVPQPFDQFSNDSANGRLAYTGALDTLTTSAGDTSESALLEQVTFSRY